MEVVWTLQEKKYKVGYKLISKILILRGKSICIDADIAEVLTMLKEVME